MISSLSGSFHLAGFRISVVCLITVTSLVRIPFWVCVSLSLSSKSFSTSFTRSFSLSLALPLNLYLCRKIVNYWHCFGFFFVAAAFEFLSSWLKSSQLSWQRLIFSSLMESFQMMRLSMALSFLPGLRIVRLLFHSQHQQWQFDNFCHLRFWAFFEENLVSQKKRNVITGHNRMARSCLWACQLSV